MKRCRVGGLDVHVVGGSDGRGGGEGPAVVLCHGFGAPGDDLVALARVVDAGAGTRWFFPEAPLEIDFGFGMVGRAWWPIDMAELQRAMLRGDRRSLQDQSPAGMDHARALLEGCLEGLEQDHGLVRSRTVLGGFSQGGMLATEVALHASTRFAGLAVLSGTLLCRERWETAAAAHGPGLSALLTHGRRDPLLPFAWAEELRAVLEGAGARVTWVPHGGQHELPPPALDALGAFVRDRAAAEP